MYAEKTLEKLGINLDQEYRHSLGDTNNVISISGLRTIYGVIKKHIYTLNHGSPIIIDLPNPVNLSKHDSSWTQYRDAVNNRPFARRYADYVRDNCGGICLGNVLLGKIGETANRVKGTANTLVFDFHNHIDWDPGMFGENRSSCWWSCYNVGRKVADHEGLIAFRLFDIDEGRQEGTFGIGRAWIWGEKNGNLNFFNFYNNGGKLRFENVMSILTDFLIKNNNSSPNLEWSSRQLVFIKDKLYVNGNVSYVVYKSSLINLVRKKLEIDLDFSEAISCDHCGQTYFVESDGAVTDTGEHACSQCIQHIQVCPICKQTYLRGIGIGNTCVCSDCYHNNNEVLIRCTICGTVYFKDNTDHYYVVDEDSNQIACISHKKELYHCANCGQLTVDQSNAIRNLNGLCYHCYRQNFVQCSHCDDYFCPEGEGNENYVVRIYDNDRFTSLARLCPRCLELHYRQCLTQGCHTVFHNNSIPVICPNCHQIT